MKLRRAISTGIIFIITLAYSGSLSAQQYQWYALGNGVQLKDTTANGAIVNCLAVDTINNILYVGGNFYYAGDTISQYAAAWDGSNWSTISEPGVVVASEVTAMIMFHDTLAYAGASGIGECHNHQFVGGLHDPGGSVNSLAVFRDTLYACGAFGIKKLVNNKWVHVASVSDKVPSYVNSLCVYKNKLIAGGQFTQIGNQSFNHIASWDGSKWEDLDGGTKFSKSIFDGEVFALGVYRDSLIVGGFFDTAGQIYSSGVAKWDGNNWYPLVGNCGIVYGILSDKAHGLYICGDFNQDLMHQPPCNANIIAKWDGYEWQDLEFGRQFPAFCATYFNNDLITGGAFTKADSVPAHYIAGLKTNIATGTHQILAAVLQLFPNPASDKINISFPFSNNTITISDLLGREVKKLKVENGNLKTIDLRSLHEGVYIVSIRDEKGNLMATQKLFKQ